MQKKRGIMWAAIFAALFLLSAGTFLYLREQGDDGSVARVYVKGELIREIDLDTVVTPYSFEVNSEYGTNTVSVAHGAIAISDANCPDLVCVKQGEIHDGAVPIICMPHRLVIKIEGAFD
ncbi:MAG: NusG domain II-containing protein [Eubacteriales bacterium]|nr:NusG domain II-containing protein [Eubacteriales bacterium]